MKPKPILEMVFPVGRGVKEPVFIRSFGELRKGKIVGRKQRVRARVGVVNGVGTLVYVIRFSKE